VQDSRKLLILGGILISFFGSYFLRGSNKTNKVFYEDLSRPAKFSEITKKMNLGSQEIVDQVMPILQDHLVGRKYDRFFLVSKFIDFYNENKSSYGSVIEAFVAFDTRAYDKEKANGVCFALTQDLLDSLPENLYAYKIGAILPGRYQQAGWHLFPHAAIVIPFENSEDLSDSGYVLLDPNFDISFPVVLRYKADPVEVDMGRKGLWKFVLRENKIVCHIFLAKTEKHDLINAIYDTMIYILKEYQNPEDAALKTMIAADRGIPIVSRDEHGKHKAHLKIDLRKKVISSSIYEKREPLISFDDFVAGVKEFDQQFAALMHMNVEFLNNFVRKIIKNADTLDTLYKEYFSLLNEK